MTNSYSLKRIRWAVFIFYFCQGLVFSSWASRIPNIKSAFGLSDAAWGTLLFMIPIGQLCGMAFSGYLVSRLGSRNILRISFPCYVLSLLAIGFSMNQYALILSLVLFGASSNFCNIAVNTQGVNVEKMFNKSIMSSFHGGWSLAGFVGSSLGLLMINLHLEPYQHFTIVSVIVLSLMLMNIKYLQDDVRRSDKTEEGVPKKRKKPEKFLFLLGFVAFCGMLAEGSMFDWSGVYFEDVVKVSPNLVPMGFAAFMLTMASGRLLADKVIQKCGRRLTVQVSGVLIFLGMFISAIYPNIVTTTLAFMIVGVGTSSIVPCIFSLAGKYTAIPVSIALTIVSSISFFGFLIGPPLIGYISQATSLQYSFGIFALSGIGITILASKIKVFKEK